MTKRIRQLIAGLTLITAATIGGVLAATPGDTHWGAEDTHWGIIANGGSTTTQPATDPTADPTTLDTHWG
ncbi:hypothetical protein [Streptomyces olivaceoviridis]|uniref:hypothetical protein n=1 Tax=Streptomyces olivaceoviridis TaxID=1921 RepID=UPI00370031F0